MFWFTCHPDGAESFKVEARSRAISAWEKAPGQPRGTSRSIGDVTEKLQMAEMVDLAWFAADKAGLTDLNIEQWRAQVDVDLEAPDEDDDGKVGPTPAAP